MLTTPRSISGFRRQKSHSHTSQTNVVYNPGSVVLKAFVGVKLIIDERGTRGPTPASRLQSPIVNHTRDTSGVQRRYVLADLMLT